MTTTRRSFLAGPAAPAFLRSQAARKRPNILFAIADDQSYPHTGVMGDRVVKTPAIDEVAGRGVLFTNAISGSPGCAPSRAAILTGRPHWQLEEAGTHASLFPKKFSVFPDLLAAAGYHIGVTGKGAGPCNWKDAGWKNNPAGPSYSRVTTDAPRGVNRVDYAANFDDFLAHRSKDQPFFFWYGGGEPHRPYMAGSGVKSGKKLDDVVVPPFLPDTREVRSDIVDYLTEIEHFDSHLGRMLRRLEKAGELENTLIVVTADNGMPFPSAKATMYDYGIHLPLAILWGGRAKGSRRVEDMISFVDFAPTFLQAAGIDVPNAMTGRSLLSVLDSGRSGIVEASRSFALSGRERHSHARFDNLGYPARALRTDEYLYIRNFKPDRWPAGDPVLFADIDDGPTKQYVVANGEKPDGKRFFDLACGKHGPEQLYRIGSDPGCTGDLSGATDYQGTLRSLRAQLEKELQRLKDPRVLGTGEMFEAYPRYSPMRPQLGGFAEEGKYNRR